MYSPASASCSQLKPLTLVLASLMVAIAPNPGSASLQPQFYCWGSDSEFPIACEDEGDALRVSRTMGLGPSTVEEPFPC
jgi:hypothetical protein